MSTSRTVLPPNNAAAYVRMSTEHQQYSTSNQMDVIREYAKRRGLEIVMLYSDEGKSGLNIQGRDSLAQMLKDVQSREPQYSCILVYDVSRWGRFQDADESAYYEYICRLAGVSVHYCAEQFENDGSPISTIVKGVKRAMAGEYSRELSGKVFQGACRLIQMVTLVPPGLTIYVNWACNAAGAAKRSKPRRGGRFFTYLVRSFSPDVRIFLLELLLSGFVLFAVFLQLFVVQPRDNVFVDHTGDHTIARWTTDEL